MDTRQRILDSARRLYNQSGVQTVSQRNIASDLGISPGNLTYHFKTRPEIEEALYFEFVEKIDTLIEQVAQPEISLQSLFDFIGQLYDFMYDYRFIFIDLVYLMSNATIGAHYRQLLQARKQQFDYLLAALIEQKVLRPARSEGEYDAIYRMVQLLTDFYFSNLLITEGDIQPHHKAAYLHLVRQLLQPFLLEAG